MHEEKKRMLGNNVTDTESPVQPHYEEPHVKDFDGATFDPEEKKGAFDDVDVGTMEDVEAIMRKYDRESNTRLWDGKAKIAVDILMALFSAYCIYATLWSRASEEVRLPIFVGCMIILGYLTYPASKKHVKVNSLPWYDVVLMLVGSGAFFYYAIMYDSLSQVLTSPIKMTPLYVVIGIIGILSLIELCRRCVGLPILCVAGALLIYTFASGKNLNAVIHALFYSRDGVFNTPVSVCAKFIVVFIIFGAFLERTGIANFFIDLANSVAGSASGGPAKVAVVASALEGMVSGSSVANTVGSGSITIPLMKKTGYKPEFAGAVEAAASTGGQIMPPIMGAAAFLMTEYVQEPYSQIAVQAILPAILYFLGIFIAVHLEAKKNGLRGIPRAELPKFTELVKKVYLLAPLIILIYLVSSSTRSIQVSASIAIVVAVIASLFDKDNRITPKRFFEALAAGARGTITVAVACGIAGIIAGCITVTGLGSKLISAVISLSGGHVIVGLLLTMVCCIILGMGVPTTANYCIMATTCAPILVELGVNLVAAHFFVFYFGIFAHITPPVALAAYAGSAIAKSNPMKTGVQATKLAIGAFIVPYVFAMNEQMLFIGATAGDIVLICITAVLGMFGVAVAMNGFLYVKLPWFARVGFMAGGLLLLVPGLATDIAGFIILVGLTVIFRGIRKKHDAETAEYLS